MINVLKIKFKYHRVVLFAVFSVIFALVSLFIIDKALADHESYEAAFVSQGVIPTTMVAGQTYNNLGIRMHNNSGGTWTVSGGYKLGSQNPQDNGTWGFGRIHLTSSDGNLTTVPAGSRITFRFSLTAPSSPGTYNFQWRMLREGVTWFGEFTPNIIITVEAAPTPTPPPPPTPTPTPPPPTPTPTPPPPPPPSPSGGLISHWTFDTDATDSVGTNDGITAGNPTFNTANYVLGGGAADFDAAGDYFYTSFDGTSLNKLTVNLWVNPAVNSLGQTGIFQWATASNPTAGTPFILLARNSGNSNLRFYIDGNYRKDIPISTNNWYMVTVTLDSSNLWRFYVDGLVVGTYQDDSNHLLQSNANQVYFGTGYNGNFPGLIDDAKIYNKALSVAEVLELYQSPVVFTHDFGLYALAPSASSVIVTEPNYCSSGPNAVVSWFYSNPSGGFQSAYQVQIDDKGSFNSPEVDSEKVNSSSNTYSSITGLLSFNKTYQARVRVWNSDDTVSDWENMSICNGSGCSGGQNQWKTPKYAYPQIGSLPFTYSSDPAANLPIQFNDNTGFDPSSGGQEWLWDFGDGQGSTAQNPTHAYSSMGAYNVEFSTRDDAMPSGSYCPVPAASVTIDIREAIPFWIEVQPR